ncbi:MAG: hypothetical protein VKK04_14135 [Synechococcales bacterium]|nr:hypothetical protein [Synechococcales bacterium]
MTVLSPLDEAVRDISLAQHLPRIKKLLVYACTQQWESDPRQLAGYHLHDLLEALLHRAPTVERLQALLYQLTDCLSKPAEYTLIANLIIEQLRPLYEDGTESVTPVSHHFPVCEAIAHQLAQDPQALRVKKLLVLLCRSVWERDAQRLDCIPWESLVRELYQRAQTSDQLRAALNSAVRTLNKRTEYGAIARTILQACEPLYWDAANSGGEIRSNSAVPTTGIMEPAIAATIDSAPPADAALPSPPASLVVKALDELDWFELRLEIMKYTNPLLAKQLLLAVLYPSTAKEQSNQSPANWQAAGWRTLREHDLGGLLRRFLLPGHSLAELETALVTAVQQLNAPHHYPQVAATLLRIIRPVLVPARSQSEHRPDKQAELPENYLQTCQIAASTTLLERSSTLSQETDLSDASHSYSQTLGLPSTNPQCSANPPAGDDGGATAALTDNELETLDMAILTPHGQFNAADPAATAFHGASPQG